MLTALPFVLKWSYSRVVCLWPRVGRWNRASPASSSAPRSLPGCRRGNCQATGTKARFRMRRKNHSEATWIQFWSCRRCSYSRYYIRRWSSAGCSSSCWTLADLRRPACTCRQRDLWSRIRRPRQLPTRRVSFLSPISSSSGGLFRRRRCHSYFDFQSLISWSEKMKWERESCPRSRFLAFWPHC